MTHARRLLWLGALTLAGCANCNWPAQPDQGVTPRPVQPVTVIRVGPGPVSVARTGRLEMAKDCRNGPAKIALSGEAGANGLTLETQVSPPGILTVDPVEIPAGAASAPVRARGDALGTATVRYRAPGQQCDLDRDCPSIEITVLAAEGCMACNADEVGRGTYSEPVCQRDTFYLEAEWRSPTPCMSGPGQRGFDGALAGALFRGFPGHDPLERAICAWGAPECVRACGSDAPAALAAGYKVRPVITPVLPDGDTAQGRFFRIQYLITGPNGHRRVHELPEWAVCDAVDRLQRAEEIALADMGPSCTLTPNPMLCDGQSLPKPRFKAGLECPVRPTQIRAQATPEQKTWHMTRLRDGLASMPTGTPGPTTVFLLDSGLHPDVRTATAKVLDFNEAAFRDPAGSDRLPHGSSMAGLIKSLAPFADLLSVRVFGTDGVARTDRLARALALVHQLMLRARDRVYLINLSLGWPAEFSLPTVLKGGRVRWDAGRKLMTEASCRAENEGVGEAVRYVLARIARDDAQGALRATVMAAAGNLPPDEVNLERRSADMRGGDRCGGKQPPAFVVRWIIANLDRIARRGEDAPLIDVALLRPFPSALRRDEAAFRAELERALNSPDQADTATDLIAAVSRVIEAPWCDGPGLAPRPFLPAAWGLPSGGAEMLGPLKMKPDTQCEALDLAVAVGAHDARNKLIFQHPRTVNPSLALPGHQVFAPAPDAPVLTDADVEGCSGLPASTTAQPLPVSGTSAATALATGVAALAQAAIPPALARRFGARPKQGLDAARLKTLLRLVSEDALGQGSGDKARRPSLCQLQAALSTCGPLSTDDVRCLTAGGSACTKFKANCNLTACGANAAVPATAADYPQGTCTPAPTVLPDPQPWTSPCSTGTDCLSGFEAGVLGPQPMDPICEFCGIRVERPGDAVSNPLMGTVTLELGSGFPFATHRVENPRLLAVVSDGGVKKKGYFELDVSTSKLEAGWSAKVTDLKVYSLSNSTTAWKSADAYLVVDTTNLVTGKRSTQFEPIAVKVDPP